MLSVEDHPERIDNERAEHLQVRSGTADKGAWEARLANMETALNKKSDKRRHSDAADRGPLDAAIAEVRPCF